MLLLFRMKWVYHWNTLSIWKICFPVLVHIFYSNFSPPLSPPWTLCCHTVSLHQCNICSLRSYFVYSIAPWVHRLISRCKCINILVGHMRVGETFIKKHMPPCTGIHPISTITCCDGIGCQKMKRRVVTSQAFIRSRCEILRCLFALSGAGFWKVLAGAQSQPQQSCLLHLPLPRPDSSGGSCCQRGHRRGYEGQEDQAGGDEQLPQ